MPGVDAVGAGGVCDIRTTCCGVAVFTLTEPKELREGLREGGDVSIPAARLVAFDSGKFIVGVFGGLICIVFAAGGTPE